MIERSCPVCTTLYLADPKRLKWGRQTTCSRACSYVLRSQERQVNKDFECFYCKTIFTRKPFQKARTENPFCSQGCYKNARIEKLIDTSRPVTSPIISFTCENCDKVVTLRESQKGGSRLRFCSADCANTWHSGENHNNWKGGNYRGYYGSNWTRQRRLARKRDDYTCQRCGISQQDYGKKLDVHHIVRFADFTDYRQANRLENLISLCHTCHIKTEWDSYPDLRSR